MSIKTMIFGIAAVAAVALPGAASAQSWGNNGYGYGNAGYGQRYDRGDRFAYRGDRRDRQRWEQRRRWEQRQRAREHRRWQRQQQRSDRGYYRY